MKILIIGMGYVGTTTGVVFAHQGHEVTGLDIDESKITSLKKGNLYFHEPGLQEMLFDQLKNGRIQFTSDPRAAVENHDVLFLTVGTPSLENGNADLTFIKKAAEMIGRYKNKEKIVVVKSTVPLGTTDQVEQWIKQSTTDPSSTHVAMNPEFLREGSALYDALHPNRIVIGSQNSKARSTLEQLYRSFTCPLLITSTKAAEMIKYASNAFLATKISFINEVAKLCDQVDVQIKDVAKGMGLDQRIGPDFLQAGLGYGGSCFPKDVKEFTASAKSLGVPLTILEDVEKINKSQPHYFINKMKNTFPTLKGKKVTLLGLSFKPDTDDIRESVAFPIMDLLLKEGAKITVHDPVVNLSTEWLTKGVTQCWDPYVAVKNSDMILIATNWSHYEKLDWAKVHELVTTPHLFDGRNMLNAEKMKLLKFHYQGIGYA
ncbi:UDP-glucose 6-dehydrogenase [Halobacillus andaensis]|uniref:UDP-glucose 6-dehydrogenase n=1 Tax=Halobacillus andaensis TaxID=1176239 RepID=A0A917BBD2_HALAA|nr:UDP-glucose/GDP-mannose dehydrogenase family protein [Halobacillus andaensis]MBP2006389.1 UDPglucose 6-dehydrogenase [Halobacillus andaensis]GGF34804.1 UDP-glucose 6-dehydrogenase [Halobacillus andaensis]